MNIFILTCCIVIPIVMIVVGILYRLNLLKKSNSILDLIISLVMMFSGISKDNNSPMYLDKKIPIYSKKKCGIIWMISGVVMLICITVLLLLNISQINSILDSLLDIEFIIFTIIFITTEYFLKKKLYHK
ncbi:hypothetical protein FDC62_08275 [Clostridium botulinum]|uniref:hypothetical protein n=1 Tax=Clostridium botulinum TaxID=1491 RepID=UPI00052D7D14|nr:hypothetical protein [Clostridium botulinum]KGM92915.1 hypothetical protein Z956_12980 [Clostridium botulinum D str. CCUG 7971]KOC49935.1 hypothetical protein ADU88_04350 [Clostridium botulinum]NFO98202.1 hypothetical protein [Clostridium botulinum]OOV52016.1 hypothetical protein B1A66_06140 [Clostridium botulinum D/C]OOV54577.1 hypothetical protein B1A67_10400 [Clostridium botulinum D/C]